MSTDSPVTVLVVEDDLTMRRLLERFLEGHGYRVHTAHCADAALELLRRVEVDIVLSDHHLGGMDGVQLLELCKRSFPEVGRLLVTAATDFGVASRAVNEGGIGALVRKPWAGPELLEAMAKMPRVPLASPSERSQRSNTIPQFTAELARTSEAPTVTWNELDATDSQRVVRTAREAAALSRLFGDALSL